MAGTLSIVSTPIGHLDDITLRALQVLRAASLIAAEDTRRTAKLLSHYGISTPTISFHEHNTRSRLPALMARLRAGEMVALVSDAGTPVLSDPGLELVQACIQEEIPVDPVPGASAHLALAVVAGFAVLPCTWWGFPPVRSKDRIAWFHSVLSTPHAVVFFEAPHRIERTLKDLANNSGDRPIVVGRELTKLHQSIYRGTAGALLVAGIPSRGEFTVMLGPAPSARIDEGPATTPPSDAALIAEFGRMEESSAARREAIRAVAKKNGLSTKYVYAAIEREKNR